MIVAVAKRHLWKVRVILSSLGESSCDIGTVVESRGPRVEYVGGAA